MALETLIKKVEERLNLNCYTGWEAKFLKSIVGQFKSKGRLTESQVNKVREIIRVRYVIGEQPHIDPTGKPTGHPFPKERLDQDQPVIRYIEVTCKHCFHLVHRLTIRMNSTRLFDRHCEACGAVTTFELDEQRVKVISAHVKTLQGDLYGAG